MNYEQIKGLPREEFKRYCGVSPETFDLMIITIYQNLMSRAKPVAPPKLCLADQLLVVLQYWREYRTYFHIAKDWGINETTVSRIVHRIEEILIKSELFKLPKKGELCQDLGIVVVDVSEQQIERPKKSRDAITAARKSITRSRPKY